MIFKKALKPKIKEEIKSAESAQSFKRQNTPDVSLSLEFVFGYYYKILSP